MQVELFTFVTKSTMRCNVSAVNMNKPKVCYDYR